MTLPRILSLGADGTLRIEPVPELEVLRYHPRQHQNVQLGASSEKILEDSVSSPRCTDFSRLLLGKRRHLPEKNRVCHNEGNDR
ncbi:MAG: hypothetical protein MUE50_22465 [Pirellulaceae bacterium]|nr:hypothetical protein [Pirellulaceae bacterium]